MRGRPPLRNVLALGRYLRHFMRMNEAVTVAQALRSRRFCVAPMMESES
jgi:hypothetical protein